MSNVELQGTSTSTDAQLDAFGSGNLIKDTRSICPVCLQSIEAQVYERESQVWMDKRCVEHGPYSALLAADIRHYYRSNSGTDKNSSCCGPVSSCCAPVADENKQDGKQDGLANSINTAVQNHSCNVLIEITERCNLSCPTCYAGSTPQHSQMLSLEEFTGQVDGLLAMGKSGSDVIQLSGGEPTIHPQLNAMLAILCDRGFTRVCINSNGIKLAQKHFVDQLLQHPGIKLSIYLQFDGFDANTHEVLRGRADLLETKRKALANCLDAGIMVHPVMTLTRAVNDHEVGDFIRLAHDYPDIKDVIIQPAMYSGRYDNPRRIDRLTLADTVELIKEQFGVFTNEDFSPIPCSDPNCFGMAVALRTESGLIPISRFFPKYSSWNEEENSELIGSVTNTLNAPEAMNKIIKWAAANQKATEVLEHLNDQEMEQLLDLLVNWENNPAAGRKGLWDRLFMVNIKPFMDAYTYDQDRIDQCCVHILNPEGQPISFCEYNAIHRPRMMAADQTSALHLTMVEQ